VPNSQLKLSSGAWKRAFNSMQLDKNNRVDFREFLSQVYEKKAEIDDYC